MEKGGLLCRLFCRGARIVNFSIKSLEVSLVVREKVLNTCNRKHDSNCRRAARRIHARHCLQSSISSGTIQTRKYLNWGARRNCIRGSFGAFLGHGRLPIAKVHWNVGRIYSNANQFANENTSIPVKDEYTRSMENGEVYQWERLESIPFGFKSLTASSIHCLREVTISWPKRYVVVLSFSKSMTAVVSAMT